MFSSTELNQYEISSDEEPLQPLPRSLKGAARSRPVDKKRKTKVVTRGRGRKQRTEEPEEANEAEEMDIYID